MTTDEQVRRLMSLIKKGLPLSTAAAKAGMSEPTVPSESHPRQPANLPLK